MSRNHVTLHPHLWAKARKAALKRAGYRSEVSGRAGRLEVHHKRRLEDGGAPYDLGNLLVVTRDEHIRMHEEDSLSPEQVEWRRFVEEIVAKTP